MKLNDHKMISQIMIVHIWKKKIIISVSKFKQYFSDNCFFISYRIDIKSYLITFLYRFCDLAHPWFIDLDKNLHSLSLLKNKSDQTLQYSRNVSFNALKESFLCTLKFGLCF